MTRDETRERMEDLGYERMKHLVYTGCWPSALHGYAVEWLAEKEVEAKEPRG